MSLPDDLVYEVFVLWSAYQELHERLGGDARTSDPRDLIGKVAAYGHDRAAAAIFADGVATSLADAERVLGDLLALAAQGRRPRYGREIHPGLSAALLQDLDERDV
ncbi:MAG: hypothetical protein WKF48_05895 [Solirubrobacteraceae bacterium]